MLVAEMIRQPPWCCYLCGLGTHGFDEGLLRSVAESESSVVNYVQDHMVELNLFYTATQIEVMQRMAEEMAALHYPNPPPKTHRRYYQSEMVSTGFPTVNAKLEGGRLQRGHVYCFFEPIRDRFGGEKLIRNILENSQARNHREGIIPGFYNAIQPALVLTTSVQRPQYLYPYVDRVNQHYLGPLQPGGMMSVVQLGIDFALLDPGLNPGVIILDVPRGVREQTFQDDDPLLEFWMRWVIERYGPLDDKIMIFLVDESLIKTSGNVDRKSWFCRFCPRTNVTLVSMNDYDEGEWIMERFIPNNAN